MPLFRFGVSNLFLGWIFTAHKLLERLNSNNNNNKKTRTNNTERNEEITWKITVSHNRAYTYSRGTEIETLQYVFGSADIH